MRTLRSFFVGLIRHTASGLFYAATVVAMATAYYTLRAYGAWAGWSGVAGVFLVALALYLGFPRRGDPT